MKKFALSFLFFILISSYSAALAQNNIVASGSFFFKPLKMHRFEALASESILLGPGTISVLPDTIFPLATSSRLIIGSTSIVLYPGAVMKIDAGLFQPLAGRFFINNENEASDHVSFGNQRFLARFYTGEYLLEITPRNTVWIAMRKSGEGWVKDFERRIVEFQPGTEVEIPPFSSTVVKEIISSRWEKAPEGAVVRDVAAVFSKTLPEDESASETAKIASDTENVEDDEDSGDADDAGEETEIASEAQEITGSAPASDSMPLD